MNGDIGSRSESMVLSFMVPFQTDMHGRREGAYSRGSEEDHRGNHTSRMERCGLRANTYLRHGWRDRTHKKIYEAL
jgi:hypothetical protein